MGGSLMHATLAMNILSELNTILDINSKLKGEPHASSALTS